MSSGFVTENELAEQRRVRQAEWERVRTDDQPLDAPEEVYDSRPLYLRLEEQKQKKDAEYEETHRLKNMIRTLDDDEVGFLDLVERTKATTARQISLEEQREMQEFRERVSSLQETAENKRLAQQLAEPAPRRAAAGATSTRAKLQGVIVRKRKLSDTEPVENGRAAAEKVARGGAGVETSGGGAASDAPATNGTAAVTCGAMKCVAVLPGLGHYEDDTTDSDNSSDSEDCSPRKPAYDLCGRRHEEKKKEENS